MSEETRKGTQKGFDGVQGEILREKEGVGVTAEERLEQTRVDYGVQGFGFTSLIHGQSYDLARLALKHLRAMTATADRLNRQFGGNGQEPNCACSTCVEIRAARLFLDGGGDA